MSGNSALATFAGGCFWCMVGPFEQLDGVFSIISGYTGGNKENPTYEEVCSNTTGHVEAVQIEYNPEKVTYSQLLDVFWKQIDPTDPGGQFHDRGESYKTAIFYHNEEQKQKAEDSKKKLEEEGPFKSPIVTPILPANTFYPAEDYHQNYHKKNKMHYLMYRKGSGRESFIQQHWGGIVMEDREQVKKRLTPIQFEVTQKNGTEPPFQNEYWDLMDEGIYVDIVSGDPLFSSVEKFESNCGWPSFTKPLPEAEIEERFDTSFGMRRTEVRSKHSDSHLGHVFSDGPPPEGLRYCINSAALRFIPRENLEKEGYTEYQKLFDDKC